MFTLFGETWYKVEYSLQRKSDLRYRETNEIANSAEAETKILKYIHYKIYLTSALQNIDPRGVW